MKKPIETIKYRGHDINVFYDSDPQNPRTDYDHVGVMFCKHGRYDLGDKDAEDPIEEVEVYDLGGYEVTGDRLGEIMESMGALCDTLQLEGKFIGDAEYDKAEGAYHEIENDIRCQNCARVEHRLRPDIALCLPIGLYDHGGITVYHGTTGRGDSAGWDSGQIGWHYVTKDKVDEEWNGDLDAARRYLEGEMQEYDDFVTGQVYGYVIDEDGDSCWDFFGYDHEKSGLLEGARDAIDWLVRAEDREKDVTAMECD